jgi:hypothetical protein
LLSEIEKLRRLGRVGVLIQDASGCELGVSWCQDGKTLGDFLSAVEKHLNIAFPLTVELRASQGMADVEYNKLDIGVFSRTHVKRAMRLNRNRPAKPSYGAGGGCGTMAG